MDDPTPLDRAHAAIAAAPDPEAARRAFFALLFDSELFLLLEREAEAAALEPRVFPLEEGPIVLAFDSEARLAAFAETAAAYAALPGRAVVPLLAEAGLGLALNLGGAPSELLLPPADVAALAAILAEAAAAARPAPPPDPEALGPAAPLPPAVAEAVLRVLARAPGIVAAAHLVSAPAGDGAGEAGAGETEEPGRLRLLALTGAPAAAAGPLARALAEAVAVAGGAGLRILLLPEGSALARRAAEVGAALPLPAPPGPAGPPAPPPAAPPRPPVLRAPRRMG